MYTENYEFGHYPSDLYTAAKADTVTIKTQVSLAFDADGVLLRGNQESRFGKGEITEIHQVKDGYSFALDMGGGRIIWYRLYSQNDQ